MNSIVYSAYCIPMYQVVSLWRFVTKELVFLNDIIEESARTLVVLDVDK